MSIPPPGSPRRRAGSATPSSAAIPRRSICYASKALSAIKALRLIEAEGLGIEVNSGGELFRAKLAGFAPDRIILNGVAKSEEELRAALSPPIKAINVDSLFELQRIIAVARSLGRQRADRAAGGAGDRQPDLARQPDRLRRHEIRHPAKRAGGSGRDDPRRARRGDHGGRPCPYRLADHRCAPYRAAAGRLAALFLEIRRRLGHGLAHINIGGGFPLSYMRGANRSPQGDIFCPTIDVEEIAEAALPLLLETLGPDVEVILEPGGGWWATAPCC